MYPLSILHSRSHVFCLPPIIAEVEVADLPKREIAQHCRPASYHSQSVGTCIPSCFSPPSPETSGASFPKWQSRLLCAVQSSIRLLIDLHVSIPKSHHISLWDLSSSLSILSNFHLASLQPPQWHFSTSISTGPTTNGRSSIAWCRQSELFATAMTRSTTPVFKA